MIKKITLIAIAIIAFSTASYAQRVAMSTDLLKWATASPSIGTEIVMSNKTSLSLEATINPFNNLTKNIGIKHINISPEVRYWFSRPMVGHFLGVNAMLLAYDLHLNKEGYVTGYSAGLGLGYGYSFVISKHWNITPNIGLGYGYNHYNRSEDVAGSAPIPNKHKFSPLVTRLGVSLSYIIR